MKKKHFKPFSIVLGILLLLVLVVHFGLNFWLKNRLPDYLKNNSDYLVTYAMLDVHLGTGNILATGVSVNNKDPQNQHVIGLQGTIDSLSVSRFGILDALFYKRISSTELFLKNPSLNITLQKPRNDQSAKERNPIVLENIYITDGDISIYRHNRQKFLSVNNLNLSVENLQMTEESVEKKLPVVFDRYDIRGNNFFFRPDNVYAFTATEITTRDNQMSIQDFRMHPLLSFAQFRKYYPKKQNLFDFKAREMDFRDMILKNNQITLTEVRLEHPDLKLYTTDAQPEEKESSFTYDLNLEDLWLNHAKINMMKPDGSPKFTAADLNAHINKLVMNDETARGNIPFLYQDFNISGQQLQYISKSEKIRIGALTTNSKSADLHLVSVQSVNPSAAATRMNLHAPRLQVRMNEMKFEDNKLKLNIENVLVQNLEGKIASPNTPPAKKKASYNSIAFPLKINSIELKNADFIYEKDSQPLALQKLNARLSRIEMNEQTVKQGLPFSVGDYSISSENLNYRTPFYQISSGGIQMNKSRMQISDFAMTPTVTRAQFIKMIPVEKDLYTLRVNQINASGSWDLLTDQQHLYATQVTLLGANANIFRSKIPKDDPSIKPMYSELLRKIKFPLIIEQLDLKNSLLEYEEDTQQSEGPGKLTFGNFNMNVKNLNSAKSPGKPTAITITINCRFMNASPMHVKWLMDSASKNDAFSISGNISDLNAVRINAFIEPYLKAKATGSIQDLIFDFKGTISGLHGTMQMKHKGLKVDLLKETGEKRKVLSAVINLFVKSNSGALPPSVVVDDVKRDPSKSFFNLFWKGIEEGLKKTLIGKNIENTEQSMKNTVTDTKSTVQDVKSKVQGATSTVKGTIDDTREKIKSKTAAEDQPEKGNLLQRLFRKKEKQSD